MTILQLPTALPGQVGINPITKKMVVTNTLAELTTAGFLNSGNLQGFTVTENDVLQVVFNADAITKIGDFTLCTVSISGGVITLEEDTGGAEVTYTAPTVANHIAVFTNTNGNVSRDVATAINGGNLQAGLSGTAGTVASFPATAAKGSLKMAAVANTGDTVTTVSNAAMGQASVISIPDPAAATANFAIAPAALVNNNLVKASGTAGLVADAGISTANVQLKTHIIAQQSADIGGAGAGPHDITVTGATATSVAVATVVSSTNAVEVLKVLPGVDKISVTFSADPGASAIISYIVFIAAQ